MRPSIVRLAAILAAIALCATIILPPAHPAAAGEARPVEPAPCACSAPEPPRRTPRPRFADLAPPLDAGDEIATLEAIRVALSEVADGAAFVWHRHNGRLSGLVRPIASFKDPAGRVCRHIVVILTTAARTGRAEGVACRLDDGQWLLEG